MEEIKGRKGFWASLFTPKSCDCCCGTQIEEIKEEPISKKNKKKMVCRRIELY